ncbi:hypothetical protein Acy02nite_45860 [Actinoplanes cyaneus]|uniref:Uncharacterized protein n=1 Tax=Actinoplanes cyaneus TaxID=52696 RepID=A0A919IIL2_9ACTN|nr:hypothetical protein Acy02nite_45860 [Actinoplanes cyaneus]
MAHSTNPAATCPTAAVDEPLDKLWTVPPNLWATLCTACGQLLGKEPQQHFSSHVLWKAEKLMDLRKYWVG